MPFWAWLEACAIHHPYSDAVYFFLVTPILSSFLFDPEHLAQHSCCKIRSEDKSVSLSLSLSLRVASSESGSFCDSYFFLRLSSAQSFSSHSAVCVCPQKRRREISFCIMLDFVTNAECTRVLLLTLSPQLCLAPLLLPSCEFMGSGATWLLFILHSLSHKRGEGKACVCEGVRVRVEGAGSVLDRD